MKLYYMPGACSLATHIVLEWIGQPYESERITHAELKKPAFLAVNPLGAVPAIEDGHGVLTQNAAILGYLAELHPEAGLYGDGSPRGRAEVTRWLAFVNADIHPAFKPLFGATAFLEDPVAVEKTRVQARERLRTLYQLADHQLEGREGLAGARSVVDAYLFVTVRWARKFGIELDDLPHLQAFMARMEADAGVQKALAAEA